MISTSEKKKNLQYLYLYLYLYLNYFDFVFYEYVSSIKFIPKEYLALNYIIDINK
jgi:hypothetical protein